MKHVLLAFIRPCHGHRDETLPACHRPCHPRHLRYRQVSQAVFAIFSRYTPLIEGLSLDEAFLDVTGSVALFGSAAHIARSIVQAIAQELQLSASAGIAPCKFVAKIASDLHKPRGFLTVKAVDVPAFLAPLPIERIWGVGQVAAAKLHRCGYHTMGQLAQASPTALHALLGEWGQHLQRLCQGHDQRDVVAETPRKSISHECTFTRDITHLDDVLPILLDHTLKVARDCMPLQLCARTVSVKLKYANWQQRTRRITLVQPLG